MTQRRGLRRSPRRSARPINTLGSTTEFRQRGAIEIVGDLNVSLSVREWEARMRALELQESEPVDDDISDMGHDTNDDEDECWTRPGEMLIEPAREPVYLTISGDEPDFQLIIDDQRVWLEYLRDDEDVGFTGSATVDEFISLLIQRLEERLTEKCELLEKRLERWRGNRLGLLSIAGLARDIQEDMLDGPLTGEEETFRVWTSTFLNNAKVLLHSGRTEPMSCFFMTGGAPDDVLNDALLYLSQRFIDEKRGKTTLAEVTEKTLESGDPRIRQWLNQISAQRPKNTVLQRLKRLFDGHRKELGGVEPTDDFERFVMERKWTRRRRQPV